MDPDIPDELGGLDPTSDPDYAEVAKYYSDNLDPTGAIVYCAGCSQDVFAEGPANFFLLHQQCVLRLQQAPASQLLPAPTPSPASSSGRTPIVVVPDDDDEEADAEPDDDDDDANSFYSADDGGEEPSWVQELEGVSIQRAKEYQQALVDNAGDDSAMQYAQACVAWVQQETGENVSHVEAVALHIAERERQDAEDVLAAERQQQEEQQDDPEAAADEAIMQDVHALDNWDSEDDALDVPPTEEGDDADQWLGSARHTVQHMRAMLDKQLSPHLPQGTTYRQHLFTRCHMKVCVFRDLPGLQIMTVC